MSPIIVTKCKCSKNNIYINIPTEKYFRGWIDPDGWELEYSKRVKEEKNQYYKENIKKNGDQWTVASKNYVICEECGEKIEIWQKKREVPLNTSQSVYGDV